MSAIPPAWLGSIIQTQGAEKQAAERKSHERGAEVERTGAGSFAESLQNVIENRDRDGQVYADAEGAGSQGRPAAEEQPPDGSQEGREGGDEAAGGLDVQA